MSHLHRYALVRGDHIEVNREPRQTREHGIDACKVSEQTRLTGSKGKSMKQKILQMMFAAFVCAGAHAQVNSGSNGSDGALDYSSLTNLGYSTNIVLNMADHPTGIYQYTYINIPNNVTLTFIPNANNTPVYWLVQSNVVISGAINISGQGPNGAAGGLGGPGGYRGGTGGASPTSGQGPGGGSAQYGSGGNASFGSAGITVWGSIQPGATYGNIFLIPLLGGSGGGGQGSTGGYGGGGAILIATSGNVEIDGALSSSSSYTYFYDEPTENVVGGSGSGGAVRIVASKIIGSGQITTATGYGAGGLGRVRFDTYENDFGGSISGVFTQGSQFIIIPTSGQLPQLTVTSVGGVAVSASPTGILSTPDAVLSAQQNNPIPVVVSCANLPLNTQITVSITPANGSPVSATGLNSTGTLSSSTATISIVIPRGGGLIYATAATSN